MVDKDSLYNIQDFRITQFTDSSGVLRQFRGASGWYFQAAATTAQTAINNTVNDERNITNRSSWGDVVAAWTAGTYIKSLANIFMGLTTFGGYLYGTRDPDITPGSPYYPRYLSDPGPIRMTYLYGDCNSYNNCRMQFTLASACKAKLTGTTQAIPNWASSGSLIPDTDAAVISIKPGTDNFIVLDGLRAIRIRPLGWLAHMADHAMKQTDVYNAGAFPAGINMVWRANQQAFAYDGSTPLGDFTPEQDSTGAFSNKLEWTGFHHFNFGNWCDTTLGAPDRYHLKARAKVWYKTTGGTMPTQPDPYKVLLSLAGTRTPPDEVVEVTATVRKTVHEGPTGPPFYDPPTYANNAGFVLSFSQTVDKIAYIHLTFHYNNQIVGTQFWGGNASGSIGFPIQENYHNTILFQKINSTDQVTDDYSASLVAMPFGITSDSPLPKSHMAVSSVSGLAVSFQVFNNVNPGTGATYQADWGDGSIATLSSLTPSHTYAASGTYHVILTVTPATGPAWSHGTWIKI